MVIIYYTNMTAMIGYNLLLTIKFHIPAIGSYFFGETGSALVYLAFFLVLYREGMPGVVLFSQSLRSDSLASKCEMHRLIHEYRFYTHRYLIAVPQIACHFDA